MKKVYKKFLSCYLVAVLIVGILPITVFAVENPYPSSQTIGGVTTVPCTRYAWQQVYDRLGIALANWGNAINWLNRASSAGYSTGSIAMPNSIAVWKSSAHSYGHVSFVTAVDGNYMTVNEGGMTDSNGNAANGTGIMTGSRVSSVVGTKKSAYSSCTLLGFVYLTNTPSTSSSVAISSYAEKNTISDTNAILWGKVEKPSSYSITKIGIRVAVDGGSYSSGWSKYEVPSRNYVGDTVMYPYYNLNSELGATLTHATKYWLQFYAVVNGTEYWSPEYTFTTTGSHSYGSWSTTKAATCTEAGAKTRKCTGCSKTENGTINALGHNYSSSYTIDRAATCTVAGSKSKHCSRCSATTSITTISVLGHTYGNDNSCDRCSSLKYNLAAIYPDTANYDWYSNAVAYAYGAGIMKGYSNGYFGTSDGIQRQDFLVLLARFDGVNLNHYKDRHGIFSDVAAGSYYEAAVNWGFRNGIVNGYVNGAFGVGDMITREQIMTFLYRYAQYKGKNIDVANNKINDIKYTYIDYSKVSDFSKAATLWAIDRGVIKGKTNTTISPQGNAQRCEIAQIMYNIYLNNIF